MLAILLTFCARPAIAGTGSDEMVSETESNGRLEQILAASCVASGVTMLIVGGLMEDKTEHEYRILDGDGYTREIKFTTGGDASSLMLCGAAMVLLGTMFMVFPVDRDGEQAQDHSNSENWSQRIDLESKYLAGGAAAVGCSWIF
jgi:hypothetical protein